MSGTITEREASTIDRRDGRAGIDRACPECGTTDLRRTPDGAEVVCDGCGLVVEDPNARPTPEQRQSRASERRREQVGPPLTGRLHDKGLTTTIDWRDEDAHGTALPPRKRRRMERLRNWQRRCRVSGSDERNLRFACGEIDRIASVLGVPESVRETASAIYRRAYSAGIVGGHATESVAASVLYAACRIHDVPRTMAETAAAARATKRDVGRAYRRVSRELDIHLEPVDPRRYLPRLRSALDCSERVRAAAADIIETTAERGGLAGKAPMGTAAAAVYVASLRRDEKEIQRDVAAAAGVSVATIRTRYHEQLEAMDARDDR